MPREGILFVVSGPSGAGKSTVLGRVLQAVSDVVFSASATTRPPRPGELDGKDYFFISQERFEEMIGRDEFLEYASVHQHYYGTPISFVKEHLARGTDVILDIDVQGARKVQARWPDAIYVFLAPPSLEELERRLRARQTETDERIAVRLGAARGEMSAIPEYQYLVVNDQVGLAVLRLQSIIEAERSRVVRVLRQWPHLDPRLDLPAPSRGAPLVAPDASTGAAGHP